MIKEHVKDRMIKRGVKHNPALLLQHLLSDESIYYRSLKHRNKTGSVYIRYDGAFYVMAEDGNIVTVMKPELPLSFIVSKQLKIVTGIQRDIIQYKIAEAFL